MDEMCHTCGELTAVIHCTTEAQNFCLTCDYMHHCDRFGMDEPGHVRYQLCDVCRTSPALLLCSVHQIILCQSCYVEYDDCVASAHSIRIINKFTQLHHNNNDDLQHRQMGNQRRDGMFEMSCNEDNTCERWMFRVACEGCKSHLNSNGVVYCAQHDMVLCNTCDRIIHARVTVPQHTRCKLCVNCKRVSRHFLVGAHQFVSPPNPPPPVQEERQPLGPIQPYNNLP